MDTELLYITTCEFYDGADLAEISEESDGGNNNDDQPTTSKKSKVSKAKVKPTKGSDPAGDDALLRNMVRGWKENDDVCRGRVITICQKSASDLDDEDWLKVAWTIRLTKSKQIVVITEVDAIIKTAQRIAESYKGVKGSKGKIVVVTGARIPGKHDVPYASYNIYAAHYQAKSLLKKPGVYVLDRSKKPSMFGTAVPAFKAVVGKMGGIVASKGSRPEPLAEPLQLGDSPPDHLKNALKDVIGEAAAGGGRSPPDLVKKVRQDVIAGAKDNDSPEGEKVTVDRKELSLKMSNILYITMGGAIDQDTTKAGGSKSGGDHAYADEPAIKKIILSLDPEAERYRVISICQKDGDKITEDEREKLAWAIRMTGAKRIIVTMGVETMVETAQFVGEAYKGGFSSGKCVVITGARAPETNKNSDAIANIRAAVEEVRATKEPGVYVLLGGSKAVSAFSAHMTKEGKVVSRKSGKRKITPFYMSGLPPQHIKTAPGVKEVHNDVYHGAIEETKPKPRSVYKKPLKEDRRPRRARAREDDDDDDDDEDDYSDSSNDSYMTKLLNWSDASDPDAAKYEWKKYNGWNGERPCYQC